MRGIRQGCPISVNIFVTIVEILAHAIRKTPEIIGLLLGTKEYKISQYADDTCLYLTDEKSLQVALNEIENFALCSGLKLNRDKSEAIWIAASSNFRHKPCGIKWTNSVISLGVKIGNDIEKYIDENYKERFVKIENIVKQWCVRNLTLKGKVLVSNTLLLSQLLYLGSCMYTPKWVFDKYKQIITKFIWNNKPSKVNTPPTLQKRIEDGGLNVQDLETKIEAIKLNWIKKLYDTNYYAPWKSHISKLFKMDIHTIMKSNLSKIHLLELEMWKTWVEINYKEPEKVEDVLRQCLCNNSIVTIAGRPVVNNSWTKQKFSKMKDIMTEEGKILTEESINRKYNVRFKPPEYNSLVRIQKFGQCYPPKMEKDLEEQSHRT